MDTPQNTRTPPASPPALDGVPLPQPHPGAVLAWCRDSDGWRSTWALPSRGGLAVQFTPAPVARKKGAAFSGFNLAILHEATGRLVAHTDSGGDPIPHTCANLRKVQAMINDLLAVLDWTQTFDNLTEEERDAYRKIVEEAQARHLPGKPAWRATVVNDKSGATKDRWFPSRAAAKKWVAGKPWYAIEHWASKGCLPAVMHLADCAAGDMPPGLLKLEWRACGVEREATPGSPPPPLPTAGPPCDTAFSRLEDLACGDGLTPATYLPTGELKHREDRSLVEAGYVTETDHGLRVTWRGFLALSRRTLASTPSLALAGSTRDALEAHRAVCREKRRWLEHHYQYMQRRCRAWLRLLTHLARDRAVLRQTGQPRFEFSDWRRSLRIESVIVADNVAEIKVDDGGRWRWYTCITRPIVPWCRDSAVTATKCPEYGTSLREHGAADWAARAAEDLRRRVRALY